MRTQIGRGARAVIACAVLVSGCFEEEGDAPGPDRGLPRVDAGLGPGRGGRPRDAGPVGREVDAGWIEEDAGPEPFGGVDAGVGWIDEDAGREPWGGADASAGWIDEDAGLGPWSGVDAGCGPSIGADGGADWWSGADGGADWWSGVDAGPDWWSGADGGFGEYPPPPFDDAGPSIRRDGGFYAPRDAGRR